MGRDLAAAAERIVLPLDFGDPREAVAFARRLRGRVGIFKVGLELFIAAGPAVIREVSDQGGGDVFLDLKLHDIPATVRGAARAAALHGVRFLSAHAAGGRDMLEAAVQGAGGKTSVLAITALTSQSRSDLADQGLRRRFTDPAALVLHRASRAREAGSAGVVCSGREVKMVKEHFGGGFLALVPGVRPRWAEIAGDDQARVTTPGEAIGSGADFIVVGRPIRQAPDPVEAAERVAEEIASAFLDSGSAGP